MKLATTMMAMLCMCLVTSISAVSDTSDPIIVVFYEEGCPDCVEMEELLVGMTFDAPETAIARYEIHEPESRDLLIALAQAYDVEVPSTVPIVFAGEDIVIGMGRTQEFSLRSAIGDCLSSGCESPIARLPITQLRADLPRLALFLAIFLTLAWLQLH